MAILTRSGIFQSTLPRKERRIWSKRTHNIKIFQSTLPRKERRIGRVIITSRLYISIHAPTQGATDLGLNDYPIFDISIHAPTQGATIYQNIAPQQTIDFNPRSHARSDVCPGLMEELIVIFQSTLPRKERLSRST